MTETEVAEAIQPTASKPASGRRQYADGVKATAQAMFAAGMTTTVISAKLDLPVATVKAWMTRGKWMQTRREILHPVQTAMARSALNEADKVKEKLTERLSVAVEALGSPKDAKDLRNQGQGYAATLKTLAETHRSLFGGAESQIMVFGASILDTTPQHIDIEANPASPEQAQSAQVVDGE